MQGLQSRLCKGSALLMLVAALLSGCATSPNGAVNDPLEPINRGIYAFNEKADQYVIEPVARGYRWITPAFVDRGITNFFNNLDDVVVFVNDVLQFKFHQAASDGGRFLVNSTIGILGFFDVATDIGLPKHNEDFGQTLGAYGLGPGPYLVIPILGPSNLRDAFGSFADTYVDPIYYIEDYDARMATLVLKGIDLRADNISTKKIIDEAALDPYDFVRSGYLQRRNYLVYDGNPPLDDLEYYEE